jgi:hypothetical protein
MSAFVAVRKEFSVSRRLARLMEIGELSSGAEEELLSWLPDGGLSPSRWGAVV